MNILITGVSGFIGQHLVNYLYNEGRITIFGASRNPERCSGLFGAKVHGFTESVTTEYLDNNNIDVIIHLAGLAHDVSGYYKDEDYFKVNFEKTCALYDAFNHSSASKFIFISSIKAAVDFSEEEISEDVEPHPVTAYGRSKLKAEEYIQTRSNKGKSFFILRPCMVYGPGNKGNLNLLYKLIKRGVPYPLGAFSNARSFLYIENFNFIIYRLITQYIPSGIYHLSDGSYLSTNELVKIIGAGINAAPKIWDIPKWIVFLLARAGDMTGFFFNSHTLNKLTENMQASNAKICRVLGDNLPFETKDALLKTVKSFEC